MFGIDGVSTDVPGVQWTGEKVFSDSALEIQSVTHGESATLAKVAEIRVEGTCGVLYLQVNHLLPIC